MAGCAALERDSSVLIDCLVEDLSLTGARVVFSAGVTIPKHFDLVLGSDGRSHRVRTVWQQANTAGIMFLEARANVPEVLPD